MYFGCFQTRYNPCGDQFKTDVNTIGNLKFPSFKLLKVIAYIITFLLCLLFNSGLFKYGSDMKYYVQYYFKNIKISVGFLTAFGRMRSFKLLGMYRAKSKITSYICPENEIT